MGARPTLDRLTVVLNTIILSRMSRTVPRTSATADFKPAQRECSAEQAAQI